MLEFVGVTKQYLYGARLFGALDLKIADGEIVAVYGGEGSGKTSFLKTAAGVEECEGKVLLDGETVFVRTDKVIMVFDDGAVFKWKTVFDNLAFPLKLRKYDKVDIASRVLSAAEKMGIGGVCLRLRARSLNDVEKCRMALARLFVRDAKLLVIDDVTFGLERADAEALWAELAPLLKEKAKEGAIVLYSTSSREEAASISDRIIVLQDGEVKQVAAYDDIRKNPENVWAAQAVDGHYNVAKCVLTEQNGRLTLSFGENRTIDAESLRGRIADGYKDKEVLCGWFPKNVGSAENSFHRDAFTEKVTFVSADKYGFELTTESGLYARSSERLSEVDAYPEEGEFVLFDSANENSIVK